MPEVTSIREGRTKGHKLIYITFTLLLALTGLFSWILTNRSRNINDESTTKKQDEKIELGIGFGLGKETLQMLTNKDLQSLFPRPQDFVDMMLGKSGNSQSISEAHRLGIKIMCVNRSIADTKAGLAALSSNREKCDYLGYNPEQSEKTPQEELNNFVASVKAFSELAKTNESLVVIGPGYGYISDKEDLYAPAAKYTDVWLIQTQVFTLDKKTNKKSSPQEYHDQVERVAKLIRQGNPEIKIWVQLIISTGTSPQGKALFTAEEIAGFAQSVSDIVDGIRIYTGNDPSQTENIVKIIKLLRG